ncbi:MAG TPA: hypothetical protein VJZ49_00115 [Syntrophales bacterium]|nr:hypothetical protein [Syntrophales bacterium]
MIHVGVRNKDVFYLKDFTGRECADISQIEEKSFLAILKFHINPRITERVVYKCGAQHVISQSSITAKGNYPKFGNYWIFDICGVILGGAEAGNGQIRIHVLGR